MTNFSSLHYRCCRYCYWLLVVDGNANVSDIGCGRSITAWNYGHHYGEFCTSPLIWNTPSVLNSSWHVWSSSIRTCSRLHTVMNWHQLNQVCHRCHHIYGCKVAFLLSLELWYCTSEKLQATKSEWKEKEKTGENATINSVIKSQSAEGAKQLRFPYNYCSRRFETLEVKRHMGYAHTSRLLRSISRSFSINGIVLSRTVKMVVEWLPWLRMTLTLFIV